MCRTTSCSSPFTVCLTISASWYNESSPQGEASRSVPTWFLQVLCSKYIMSWTIQFYLWVLEGNKEQWPQPILLWKIVVMPQPTTQREVSQAWHWDFVKWYMTLVGNAMWNCSHFFNIIILACIRKVKCISSTTSDLLANPKRSTVSIYKYNKNAIHGPLWNVQCGIVIFSAYCYRFAKLG